VKTCGNHALLSALLCHRSELWAWVLSGAGAYQSRSQCFNCSPWRTKTCRSTCRARSKFATPSQLETSLLLFSWTILFIIKRRPFESTLHRSSRVTLSHSIPPPRPRKPLKLRRPITRAIVPTRFSSVPEHLSLCFMWKRRNKTISTA
jgi:hypothetical protein